MKRWWIPIVAVYILILIGLSVPVVMSAFYSDAHLNEVVELFAFPWYWVWLLLMAVGAACLLFIPVRAARADMRNRRALTGPIIVISLFLALMFGLVITNISFAIWGDENEVLWGLIPALAVAVGMWIWWSVVFLRYTRQATGLELTRTITNRLLAGSVLELLVALPCHIIVRRRDDCCAPLGTFVGIAMGIAVMLMSFGPGVLFLYMKRYSQLRPKARPEPPKSEPRLRPRRTETFDPDKKN